MSKYDPDRITEENFDVNDREMVEGYLDHPNTVAMHSELARQFRASPPEEQIPVIEKSLQTNQGLLGELQEVMRQADPSASDPRWALVDKFNEMIALAEARLQELYDQTGGA